MGDSDLLTPTDPAAFRARVLRRAVQLERRRRVARALMAVPVVVAVALFAVVVAGRPAPRSSVAAGVGTAVTTEIVPVDGAPWSVVTGTDRSVWVLTRGETAALTNIRGDGTRRSYVLPSGASPESIVAGTDHAIWMTDPGGERVLRVAVDGSIETWPTTSPPSATATWLAGRLWYAEPARDRISGIGADGDTVHHDVPPGRSPTTVTTGPDGAVWFASGSEPLIGSVGSSGAVNELPLAGPDDRATVLASGPGPALWLVVSSSTSQRLAHVDAEGHVVDATPLPSGAPPSLSIGPDGRIWYATGTTTIGLQLQAKLTALELGRPLRVDAWSLAADGSMLAVDRMAKQLVRITIAG